MPILPIDTGRYCSPEMREVFDDEGKLQRLLDVEAALALAHAQVGDIPKMDAEKIAAMSSVRFVKLDRVKAIEAEIKHDIMSVVRALSDVCGPSGGYVHLGATSNDITDTATALQLKDATSIIEKKMDLLEEILLKRSSEEMNTLIIGRTHGQHAIPTTLGFKFAVWLREVARHIERLDECSKRVLVGKMSGAVGTQAGLGANAMSVQELTMKKLGIQAADISTQIIQRDVYAELIIIFANAASSLDKFALEIRELQRPEIAELAEPFEREKQVGSSTMPQKRNPEMCERVCGLAKILRSLTVPALENVPTWHERDLTQSSAERFIIPEACILLDYMLFLMNNVLRDLHIDRAKMRKNIDLTQGRVMSESVMLALAKKGLGRQEAHNLIRNLALESELNEQPFRETLEANTKIRKFLSNEEIKAALAPEKYLGTALIQVKNMIKKTEKERKIKHT
ncbi:MAG: adenylosuccinate lyase [Candidatus Bathyarchaeota archaeon]